MKKYYAIGFLVLSIVTLSVTSCAGTAQAQKSPVAGGKKGGTSVFLHVNEAVGYRDIAAIAIEKWKTEGIASYSVDRYEAKVTSLMILEIGSFVITGDQIIIDAGDHHLVGTINEKEIVIGGTVYSLQ